MRKSYSFLKNSLRHIFQISFLIVLLIPMGTIQAGEGTPSFDEATNTIDRYFTALATGDTKTISALLGKKLRDNRDRLLSNPTYGDTLIEWYKNVSYTISDHRIVGADKVSLTVKVLRNGKNPSQYLFTIQKNNQSNLLIIDEEEVL